MGNSEKVELKVGDRVRLTGIGPKSHDPEWSYNAFIEEGNSFPVDCKVNGKNIFNQFIVLDYWSINHFTYEKLPDETPLP